MHNSGGSVWFHRNLRLVTLLAQPGHPETSKTIGEAGTLSNAHCSVDVAKAEMFDMGERWVVALPISFTSAFAGAKNVYLGAADRHSQFAGPSLVGTWTAGGSNRPITTNWHRELSPAGTFRRFEVSVTSQAPLDDFHYMVGPNLTDTRDGCHVWYNRSVGLVLLAKDGGAWSEGSMWQEDTGPPESAKILQNSQCQVNLQDTKILVDGSEYKLQFAIRPVPQLFAGEKSVITYALSGAVPNLDMGVFDSIQFEAAPPLSGELLSVSPLSGTGSRQIFTFLTNPPHGANFVHTGIASFDAPGGYNTSEATACKIQYHRSSGRVNLLGGTTTATEYESSYFGKPGVTITNGTVCRLHMGSSSLTAKPEGLEAKFDVEFLNETSIPGKSIYMRTRDKAMQLTTPVPSKGGWTISTSTVSSVTPNGFSMPETGGTGSFTLSTNALWKIEYPSASVTVTDAPDQSTGSGGRSFVFTVQQNMGSVRPIQIKFLKQGTQTELAVVTITQAGRPVCEVSPAAVHLDVGQSIRFNVTLIHSNGQKSAPEAAGYTVAWGLYTTASGPVAAAPSGVYGLLDGNGNYSAPGTAPVTVYARANCYRGTYQLDAVSAEIQVKSFAGPSGAYAISASKVVGRELDLFLQQQTGPTIPVPVELLVAEPNVTSAVGQCLILYNPGASQMFQVVDDSDGVTITRPANWSPIKAIVNPQTLTVTQAGTGMAQNSKCLLDYERAWEAYGAQAPVYIKWNIPLSFHPGFVGIKEIKFRALQGDAQPWTSQLARAPFTVPNLPNNPPAGAVLTPAENATASGTVTFTGWALDNTAHNETAIRRIKVYLDGNYLGLATLGQTSTACASYPGRAGCPNVGFTFTYNLTGLGVGSKLVEFLVEDSDSPENLKTVLSRRITLQ